MDLIDLTDLDVEPLAAGDFRQWAAEFLGSTSTDGMDVPCGECDACCHAALFIHIEADEIETLERIPAALRFPAPGLPDGTVVLGFDENGRCPMLTAQGCGIYAHRPRTCRHFDCRVLSATALGPGEPARHGVSQQAARWQFSAGLEALQVVRNIARWLLEQPEGPTAATDLAALALRMHQALAGTDPGEHNLQEAFESLMSGRAGL